RGAAAEPGSVERHVDLLRALHLKHPDHRRASAGGCLPVDFIPGVAGKIFAEFLELAALARVPDDARACFSALQEFGRGAVVEQVGIDADGGGKGKRVLYCPETQPRLRANRTGVQAILSAARAAEFRGLLSGSE